MLSKRFCFRKAQPMTSGILYPCRIVSQFRRPTGFGGRCATRVMNIMNRAQYHRVLTVSPGLKGAAAAGTYSGYRLWKREHAEATVEKGLLQSLWDGNQ